MQLIERYLEAVKFWLPRRQQADIAAELYSNLLAQAEDKEVALGRPLEEEDEAAILRQFGPPALAAARYRQDQGTVALGRQLIGPLVFPFYAVAVKATLCITALLVLLPVAIQVLSGSDHIMQKVIQSCWDFARRAPQVLMVVTVIFTVLDYCLRKYRFAERWNPRSLPALDRAGRGVPRANSRRHRRPGRLYPLVAQPAGHCAG